MSTKFGLLLQVLTASLALLGVAVAVPAPASKRATSVASAAGAAVSVTLDNLTYVNKGAVGFGLIPSDFKESTGDTIGGIGSAIAIKPGTWKQNTNGTYSGTLVVHPDRGYNVEEPIDYQSRRHEIAFTLAPYTGTTKLTFAAAQQTLQLAYLNTVLEFERNGTKTSGLDPNAIRPAQSGFPSVASADPQLPIASTSEPHLTLDVEGLVLNADGSYWISDEYGPYIYRYSSAGQLLQTIQPPNAVLPRVSGNLDFTSLDDPDTGRAGNHGFESLTIDPTTNTLYAMLQSATIQDGGDDKGTSRYTRLFAWNVANPTTSVPLIGEWVVPLPLSDKGNTEECNEIKFLGAGVFLALSRDGDGRGGDDNNSKYKQVDLFSIAKATNIKGTKFDDPANPVSPKGKLDKSVTAATYVSFVNFVDSTQLGRFGLHNDDPDDVTLIDAKWESLALAPVGDAAYPNDYFLFLAADNDFISTHGVSLGVPFNAGSDVDNQFLVYRVTLPSVVKGTF
ncbi:esterase-like activity of phytase-domain-containing protein [Crepidotus variabilis]|uniref:Esterase-like activity of phytase-domain-containing protein n=1 Tax=Crepidotus variabilis TaxID=179855 RepID=A0A9P6EIB9_9AGAR|nr:esterase-like activity of phytase-domain-containing protein [Crepidotus variabilis]